MCTCLWKVSVVAALCTAGIVLAEQLQPRKVAKTDYRTGVEVDPCGSVRMLAAAEVSITMTAKTRPRNVFRPGQRTLVV